MWRRRHAAAAAACPQQQVQAGAVALCRCQVCCAADLAIKRAGISASLQQRLHALGTATDGSVVQGGLGSCDDITRPCASLQQRSQGVCAAMQGGKLGGKLYGNPVGKCGRRQNMQSQLS